MLRRLGLDARRADRPVLPAQLPRPSSPTSTGGTRRCATSSTASCGSGSTRGVAGVPHRRRAHGRQGPRAARQPADRRRRRRLRSWSRCAGSGQELQRAAGPRCTTSTAAGASVADSYDPPRLLVGETFVEQLDDLFPFYGTGDELHLDFNIPFAARAVRGGARSRGMIERTEALSRRLHAGVDRQQPRHPTFPTRWAEGDPDRARCALMMLLTLRGSVFLYEGDEIGMTDVDVPRDELVDPVGDPLLPVRGRDPVRTPMQWTGEPGARVHRARGRAVAPVRRPHVQRRRPARRPRLVPDPDARPDRVPARPARPAHGRVDRARRARRRARLPPRRRPHGGAQPRAMPTRPSPVSTARSAIGTRRSRDGEAVAGSLTARRRRRRRRPPLNESVRRDH